jgi:hypothetical protein
MSLVIKRSDGLFYAGTADRKPQWTEKRETAAPFRERPSAEARVEGLEKLEAHGRTFEIEGA